MRTNTTPNLPEGMKPWSGGDSAPDDWDGGDVLMEDLSQSMGYYLEPADWRHGSGDDIIAYTPRSPSSGVEAEEQRTTIERLRHVIDRDRYVVAIGLEAIRRAIGGHTWLLEGRGPYAWDDDDYRREFGAAIASVEASLMSLAKIAADKSDCTTDSIKVQEARDAARQFLAARETAASTPESGFQAKVHPWLMACFGELIAGDREERNHRFLEEALELVQACGCTASEAHQLVDYVYGRPVGELHQEVGGVMVTLAALCLANDADMHAAGWVELDRIWGKVEAIRAKQAAKPKHSPLPQTSTPTASTAALREALEVIANGDVDVSDTAIIVGNGASTVMRQVHAALAAHPPQDAARDMVLVPRVPTQKMREAGTEVDVDDGRGRVTALNWEESAEVWSAMLAASESAGTSGEGV